MDGDQTSFARSVERIFRLILLTAVVGALAGWIVRDWRWSAGFLLGALASYFNFRWLKQLVDSLGEAAVTRRHPRARIAAFMGLRYLLLGLAAYVILNFSELSLNAALMGLFVSVAAVLLEIIFELIYAGT